MLPIYQMPGHLIRRVQQIGSALFAEECSALGVTPMQYAALIALRQFPSSDATRLSALIAFDRSTIGDVLDRMETKGWIVRQPCPGDRRIKRSSLTDDGEKALTQATEAVERAQQRLLEPLGPEDRATMIRLLSRITEFHNDTTSAPLRVPEVA